MLVGISDLHTRATSIIRGLRAPDAAPVLVAKRHHELVAMITPLTSAPPSTSNRSVSMREFSRYTTQVLAQVRDAGGPTTLTNHGRPVAVIKPVSAADAMRHAAEMAAQSQAFVERLERSEDDLTNGTAQPSEQFAHRLDGGPSFDAAEGLIAGLNPAAPVGAATLGHLLMEAGDLEGAEDAYRRADDQGSGPGACNLGLLLEQRDELGEAEAAYERADQRGNREGAINLARMRRRRGDLTGERAALERASERAAAKAH